MVLPRPFSLRGAQSFGRIASRRAGIQARGNTLKNIGRRAYASGHEAKQSSDVPWMIGAVVVTVPAATWLLGQGPSKSDHGHSLGEHEENHEEGGDEEPKQEESEAGKDEESKEEPKAESKDEEKDDSAEDSKADSAEDSKAEAKNDSKDAPKDEEKDGYKDDAENEDKGDSNNPVDEESDGPSSGRKAQYFRNPNKKPGEGQKGDRPPTEKKGEKDSKGNYSGAEHPYISDPSKSRKSAGVTETAKIHGTAKPTYANPTEPSRPAPPSETKERA